jgi:hypothetical protein
MTLYRAIDSQEDYVQAKLHNQEIRCVISVRILLFLVLMLRGSKEPQSTLDDTRTIC